jgi:hypothetical protein
MPAFVVLMEGGTTASGKNLWNSDFLPSSYQAAAALIKDLKQRGLLNETLVIRGGEAGC